MDALNRIDPNMGNPRRPQNENRPRRKRGEEQGRSPDEKAPSEREHPAARGNDGRSLLIDLVG